MDTADRPADADDDAVLPSAEALLAGTLALMTGFAEHHPHPPTAASMPAEGAGCVGRAVPHLMAAKVASNLFFLSEHPLLSPAFRSTLWRLRSHWQALERCAAAPPPSASQRAAFGLPPQPDIGVPPALWLDAPPTRH